MSKRTRILSIGNIDTDGAEFQLDETPNTYTWDGETFLGYGVHKRTRSKTGVGVDEVMVYADKRMVFAMDHFEDFARLVKAGAFENN